MDENDYFVVMVYDDHISIWCLCTSEENVLNESVSASVNSETIFRSVFWLQTFCVFKNMNLICNYLYLNFNICIVLMCVDCVLASLRIAQADPGWQTPAPRWLCHRKWLHLPILCCLRSFPRLLTSSAGKRGSLWVHASQNGPRQRSGHRPAHRRSLSSH
jgi:hypothetical protein